MAKKISSGQNLLRKMALIVALIGAVGSIYFMVNAGKNQKSVLLIVLFIAWVLSPFLGVFIADRISKRWMVHTRLLLHCLMIILAICSLVIYSGWLIPPGTKPAFPFLVVPLLSWLPVITVVLVAKNIPGKSEDTHER